MSQIIPLPSQAMPCHFILLPKNTHNIMGSDNLKKRKPAMRGLCHSPAATAVCVPDSIRSVVTPTPTHRYSRLVQPTSNRPLPSAARPPPTSTVFQVVVLRVSLHCQGCAAKLKKHLLKMEGVTSFSIDLETKRVTVMGHITPDAVLDSISKVKRAQLLNCLPALQA